MLPEVDGIQRTLPNRESCLPPLPPLLEIVERVFVATTENNRKLAAVQALFEQYPVIRGTEILMPQPHQRTDEEPSEDNAIQVSRSKVENVLAQLKGLPGPKTAVFGSDIVLWLNGQLYQNLSRLKTLTSARLHQEVAHLQGVFSREVEAVWDVATSVSICDLRVTLADRHVAHFQPIPADAIYWAWEKDKGGFKKRNSRVQLLDDFRDYIIDIGSIPFHSIADRDGEFFSGQEWVKAEPIAEVEKDHYVRDVLAQVVGGLPVNGRLDNLLSVKPSAKCQRGWMLV